MYLKSKILLYPICPVKEKNFVYILTRMAMPIPVEQFGASTGLMFLK